MLLPSIKKHTTQTHLIPLFLTPFQLSSKQIPSKLRHIDITTLPDPAPTNSIFNTPNSITHCHSTNLFPGFHLNIAKRQYSNWGRYGNPSPPDYSEILINQTDQPEKYRLFSYLMCAGAGMVTLSATKSTVFTILDFFAPTAEYTCFDKIEIDLSEIPVGKNFITNWKSKPIFVRHRTQQDIELARKDDKAFLKDKQLDSERTLDPEWLVCIGICTHLGCVPIHGIGDYGGWFCPCHGSHFDSSGRARYGPAAKNLEIPKYKFIDSKTILLG